MKKTSRCLLSGLEGNKSLIGLYSKGDIEYIASSIVNRDADARALDTGR